MRHLTVIVVLMVTVRTQSRDPYANVDWKGLKSGGYAVVTEKDDGAPTTYNSKTGWSSGDSGFVVYNKPADPPMTKEEQEKYDELVRLLSPTGSDSTKKKKSASSEELTKSEQEKYDFLKKHLTPASPSAKPTARPSSSRYGGGYGTGPSPSLSRPSYRRFSSTNPTEETEAAKPSTTTSPYDTWPSSPSTSGYNTRPSISSPTTTRFNFNWRTPSTSPTSTLTDTTQPEQPSSPTSPYDTRPSSPSTSGYDTRPFSPSTSGYDTRPSSPSTSPFDTRPSSPSTSGYDTRPSITSPTTNPYNWRTPLPNLAVLNKDEFNRRFPADKSFIIEKRKQMGLE